MYLEHSNLADYWAIDIETDDLNATTIWCIVLENCETGEVLDKKEIGEEEEKDERVKILLEKDNQVRHALQLLQTWNIFSQIKTAP